MEFKVNPFVVPKFFSMGDENTNVIVIDDFSADLAEIRVPACTEANFAPDGVSAYPGVRAHLPDGYVGNVLAVVKPLIYATYAVPCELISTIPLAYYSLLTKKSSELKLSQRIPHFDTNNPHYYAVLHYLNEGEFGGTGFFRHRPTGFERITEDRKDIFMQSAAAFMAVRGAPQSKYINRSTNHFELFSQVEYKANRLVIYPGNVLHSGLVFTSADLSNSPENGRLTANIFVDCS